MRPKNKIKICHIYELLRIIYETLLMSKEVVIVCFID